MTRAATTTLLLAALHLAGCAAGTAARTNPETAPRCSPNLPNWPCANAACTLCCCEDGVDLQIPRAMCCVQQLDGDGDGIADQHDRCPRQPEDKDGHQDADGCPEVDNDGDGIADRDDLCPDEPEDMDGHQDTDGCPEVDPPADCVDKEGKPCLHG